MEKKGYLLPVKGILDTPKKVREARKRLEEATEEDFKRYDEAKRNAWHLAKTDKTKYKH